ncbi:low temperature requirement protein A [Cryptosporangium aurantiacum]|uniref:Low temperature requirement protein LtrA n=1 Tax=Cryptosporangium aurantiacum TaxID=134849 RepID=A0A1M7RCT1_9ACTN|nr:low temperature requirement protein A [Cryptosporangium aurantiacum]SHN44093.1 Low temperature requirement protein LtrA [Cryptosporangium aurantiacum]
MTVSAQRYWRRAELRRDEEDGQHRPVGWLELFFDLVFVVIIGVLAEDLAHDPHHLPGFILQFMALFWVWNAFTYYTERFETDGLENRLFTFLAMVTVAGLAVWAPHGLDDNYVGFAGSYLAARGLNIALWLRAGVHERAFLPIAVRFATGYAIAVVLIVAGAVTENVVFFGVAVVVEIITPSFTAKQQGALPPLSRSKWPERFGLFTMIVLGEMIIGVIHALSDAEEKHLASGVLGLAIGFAFWWLYYDFIARRPSRQQIVVALGWVYLHLLTLLAITVAGAMVSYALAGHDVPDLLFGSVGAALAALGVLETTLERDESEPTHPTFSPALKIGLGGALAAVALLPVHWSPAVALLVCLLVLAVPAAYGARVWYRA